MKNPSVKVTMPPKMLEAVEAYRDRMNSDLDENYSTAWTCYHLLKMHLEHLDYDTGDTMLPRHGGKREGAGRPPSGTL